MSCPFRILGIHRDAGKAEIIKRVAECLKERPHEIQVIAQAQKQLFDPKERALAEFLAFLDMPQDDEQ